MAELDQLHRRVCFTPISVKDLTAEEKRKAQLVLMLLLEKSSGKIKGQAVYSGKNTLNWLTKEDTTSPTAVTEGIFITGVIDAKEEQDNMSADIPNAFIQVKVPKKMKGKDPNEKIVMKITGKLVDMLVAIAPEIYGPFVVYENGKKVLYVIVLRALYGMLISAMLWYNKF